MPSLISMCNGALRKLGEEPIMALDDNSVWSKRCSAAVYDIIDEILRLELWRCCIKRAQLAASSEEPIGEYSYQYPLPADFIKLGAVKMDRHIKWSMESRKILTTTSAPLEILYVYRELDPNQYTSELYTLMQWRLAVELSGWSATSSVRMADTYEGYEKALRTAIDLNSHESPPILLEETSWVDARHTGIDQTLQGAQYYPGA